MLISNKYLFNLILQGEIMELKYKIKKDDYNKTINEILCNEFNFSNRLLTKLINTNRIYFNDVQVDTRNKIKYDGTLKVNFDYNEDNSNIIPTKMDLNIIYEDEWILAINKPAGIPIHPSRLHYTDSMSNGVKYYFNSIHLNKKIRPVNRLDLNTSGLVVFAKCEYIQEQFSKQMSNNLFKKDYLCIVDGILQEKTGIINLPISRKHGSIIERTINQNGKNSVTHYTVLNEFENYSFIQCKLETGRTHQIRVHMQAIGHPILGDTLYGKKSKLINRQALHSYKIEFIHPISKQTLTVVANLPNDMNKLL